jgi:hypothetical protein
MSRGRVGAVGQAIDGTVHGERVTAVLTGIGLGRTSGFARLSPRRGRRFSGGDIGHGLAAPGRLFPLPVSACNVT